jgi:hypothetical protein
MRPAKAAGLAGAVTLFLQRSGELAGAAAPLRQGPRFCVLSRRLYVRFRPAAAIRIAGKPTFNAQTQPAPSGSARSSISLRSDWNVSA